MYRRLLVDVAIILILALLFILIARLEYRQTVTTIETAPVIPPEWSAQYDPDPGVPAYQLID